MRKGRAKKGKDSAAKAQHGTAGHRTARAKLSWERKAKALSSMETN